MKRPRVLSPFHLISLLLVLAGFVLTQAAMVLTQVGSGTVTPTVFPTNQSGIPITTTAMTVNRTAVGFGDLTPNNPNVIEGVYFTYEFTVGANATTFDMQNQLNSTSGSMWGGWGGSSGGQFQRGPTTSNWSRGIRYQHGYSTGVSSNWDTTITPNGNNPALTVPLNTTLLAPLAGHRLHSAIYLNAVTDSIDYVFTNLTTGETFMTTRTGVGSPTSTATYNSLLIRGGDVSDITYTYGTIAIVPEPSRAILLGFAGLALFFHRRR